ncbi:helix-turn-helix domain-containing protein [Altererythrobacter epoxidivorans]|uniref:helix-turn-helix domain-containing protein n=1 Tax=Altererythrobacter epoxidivorans TaxID=361183 RepID=UPI0007819949|nr:helix-turn-helix domain-containing protein [Altererythrobacter epoxidivorans]
MTNQTACSDDPLLTTKEAAAYLGSTENSLRSYRAIRRGPRFIKIGSAVMYRERDLNAYLAKATTRLSPTA